MTKVGEESPHRPRTEAEHQLAVRKSIPHLEKAVRNYSKIPREELFHLQAEMDRHMETLETSGREVRTSGLHKQLDAVRKSYEEFRRNPKDSTAFLQNLSTLREYAELKIT